MHHTPTPSRPQYIPGSHKWGASKDGPPCVLPITGAAPTTKALFRIKCGRTGLTGDMLAISQTLTPAQNDALARPVAVPLKAGYAAFHHPLLVHGSFANSSSCSRRATVINLIR